MIHRVTFRAFVASTEDDGKVREALSLFVPKGSVSKTTAVGHFGNEIIILSATLGKKEGQRFFLLLREALPEGDMARLRREAAQRVDDDCKLHLPSTNRRPAKGRSVWQTAATPSRSLLIWNLILRDEIGL